MSPRTQAKILRAIQDGKISRVGGTRTIATDVRIVAATNRDLPKMIAAGSFREDLYFRLAVVPIRVPTLAERPEDVPVLAAHFAGKLARRRGRRPPTFSPEALEELKRRPWPGNVRELQNVVERALLLADGAVIGPEDLPGDVLRLPRAGGRARARPPPGPDPRGRPRRLRAPRRHPGPRRDAAATSPAPPSASASTGRPSTAA